MGDMQKDLVLSINEYAFVLDKTKGNVSCWVGPVKTSLSTSDELVRFNETTKSFESCSYEQANNQMNKYIFPIDLYLIILYNLIR